MITFGVVATVSDTIPPIAIRYLRVSRGERRGSKLIGCLHYPDSLSIQPYPGRTVGTGYEQTGK